MPRCRVVVHRHNNNVLGDARKNLRFDTTRTGGQLLVDALKVHGVDMVFGVPGESYLAALDASTMRDDIKFGICRQEGGAANMAEAYGN
jgi:acetolactate synthase-1/2/3 large subunit